MENRSFFAFGIGKKTGIILLLAVVCVINAFTPIMALADNGTVKCTVMVTDLGLNPIAGATVTVYGGDVGPCVTGASGEAELFLPRPMAGEEDILYKSW